MRFSCLGIAAGLILAGSLYAQSYGISAPEYAVGLGSPTDPSNPNCPDHNAGFRIDTPLQQTQLVLPPVALKYPECGASVLAKFLQGHFFLDAETSESPSFQYVSSGVELRWTDTVTFQSLSNTPVEVRVTAVGSGVFKSGNSADYVHFSLELVKPDGYAGAAEVELLPGLTGSEQSTTRSYFAPNTPISLIGYFGSACTNLGCHQKVIADMYLRPLDSSVTVVSASGLNYNLPDR